MKTILVVVGVAVAVPALAQDVQQYAPAATMSGLVAAKGAKTLAPMQSAAGLSVVYARNPLVLRNDSEQVAIVRNRLDLVFSYAMGITSRLDLAVLVPYVPWQEGAARWDGVGFLRDESRSSGLADPRVEARVGLLDEANHGVGLSLIPVLTLPVSSGSYQGEPSFIFTPELAAARHVGSLLFASNLGLRLGQNAKVGDLYRGPSLVYRGGVGMEMGQSKTATLVSVELFGSTNAYAPFMSEQQSPLEAMGSVRQRLGDMVVGVSGGAGLVAGFGAPLFRTMLSVSWAPLADDDQVAPIDPIVLAKAPTPEPPQVADLSNERPVLAAVPVALLDADSDGLTDDEDACPNEPETINEVDDTDGCPDEGASLVSLEGDEIVMDETVFFGIGKLELRPRAKRVLNQVAALLHNHKEVTRVTVEGHTDTTGSERRNLELSTTRAEVVRRYLVGRGIVGERLEVVGHGSTTPRAKEDTAFGKARNRRVQFRIVEGVGPSLLGAL